VDLVTNKVYVANNGSASVTVIDGATNTTTTVSVGDAPYAVGVDPVTGKIYIPNRGSDDVTVITAVSVNDTKVRAAFVRLPGDTTSLARPALTGKGVNRWTPGRTTVMGVLNRLNTAQRPWSWADITSGGGSDSATWSYNWDMGSLIWGENFVCCVPIEAQAATTNNLGLGTPFAGNLEVYPVYRVKSYGGLEENPKPQASCHEPLPTMIRAVLYLPRDMTEIRSGISDRVPRPVLLDVTGRMVLDLHPGANDVSRLAPGVYFYRLVAGENTATRKMVKAE
jgi:YVTN family beta-propeller protein